MLQLKQTTEETPDVSLTVEVTTASFEMSHNRLNPYVSRPSSADPDAYGTSTPPI